MDHKFYIKFWGVRGSIPVPGVKTNCFGGNTSCVEIRCNDKLFILDCGTGIRALGDSYKIKDVDILLSHTHLDHIQGLPFFKPLYHGDTNIRIWAGNINKNSDENYDLKHVLSHIMKPPIFPISIDMTKAKMEFIVFKAGQSLTHSQIKFPGLQIDTLPLNHPDGSTAYKFIYKNKIVCYVTDVEHECNELNKDILNFIENADIFIYDSSYGEEEYKKNYVGWGHSTWEHGVKLANAAKVKKYVAFHHNYSHDDNFLESQEIQMQKLCKSSVVAREGMIISL